MPARSPEELDVVFSQALNSGDVDTLVSLYEADSVLTPEPGQVATGHAAIREALNVFIGMKPQMTLKSKTIAQTDDIALTTAKWLLKGTGPDGPIEMTGNSVEVARRQADGTWLFVIDHPWGLDWNE
jgi:uncharacterized protein (TIGR02246 family)